MTIEAVPHRTETHHLETNRASVEKSPNCPEDLDPYGEIPAETELLKPKIKDFRFFFLGDARDEGWGKGRPSPEGIVDIHAGRDDQGRKALIVSISHLQPAVRDDEVHRGQIHRYFLYANNVGTYQVLDHVFRELSDEHGEVVHVHEDTVLDQGFMEEIHLASLKYARMILKRNP